MLTVKCFLCDGAGFDWLPDRDNPGYMDVFPLVSRPEGKFFQIRSFSEYPEKNDTSKSRPCVHFQGTELRIGASWRGLAYHKMDFGWGMNQVIYVCPNCLKVKKDETSVEFLQRLDAELIKKIDKKVLIFLLAVVNNLQLFSFTNSKIMKRRFKKLRDADRSWIIREFNELYPIFTNADQERSGKTRKWMGQLAKVICSQQKSVSPSPA